MSDTDTELEVVARYSTGDLARRGPGRPPHEPTEEFRDLVRRASAMGLPQEAIAKLLKIGVNQLVKYYRGELDLGGAHANLKVTETLFSIATDKEHKGCVAAAIFWSKARNGWREVTRTEHTGADGTAIKAEITATSTIDASQLSPEQREALREVITARSSWKAVGVDEEEEQDGE